jgi:hypothetical protein
MASTIHLSTAPAPSLAPPTTCASVGDGTGIGDGTGHGAVFPFSELPVFVTVTGASFLLDRQRSE